MHLFELYVFKNQAASFADEVDEAGFEDCRMQDDIASRCRVFHPAFAEIGVLVSGFIEVVDFDVPDAMLRFAPKICAAQLAQFVEARSGV